MKKFLCLFLSVIMLFMCGCTIEDKKTDKPDAVLQVYLNNISDYEVPVREYGNPASHISMDENLVVGVMYPETNEAFLNKEINKWIAETIDRYTSDSENAPDVVGNAELTFSYESYMANETTLSIVMKGTHFAPYMAHPEDIVKVFNADLENHKLFNISELFEYDSLEKFIKLIVTRTGVNPDDVDEHFLDNSYLTSDSLVVILERGAYLPMSSGTKTIVFDYSEISALLRKSFEEHKNTPPEEEKLPDIAVDSHKLTVDPDKPMLALTFDDGPSAHTEVFLLQEECFCVLRKIF